MDQSSVIFISIMSAAGLAVLVLPLFWYQGGGSAEEEAS